MDVPVALWMTTTGGEDVTVRARTRARLRRMGRAAWQRALELGARPVDRFMLTVAVAGRGRESPVLAAETVKPLVDAGTDMGLWPDDDPWHRVVTCYIRDPEPRRWPRVTLSVTALGMDEHAPTCLLARVHDPVGLVRGLTIPDADWLTSNMRLDADERRGRQSRIMRHAAPLWNGVRFDGSCCVACGVRYPDARREYKGDPDNTAESATAMWGAGVLQGGLPANPRVFAFFLLDGCSRPRHHDLEMLVFRPGGCDGSA